MTTARRPVMKLFGWELFSTAILPNQYGVRLWIHPKPDFGYWLFPCGLGIKIRGTEYGIQKVRKLKL